MQPALSSRKSSPLLRRYLSQALFQDRVGVQQRITCCSDVDCAGRQSTKSKLSSVLGMGENFTPHGGLDPRRAIVLCRGTLAALAAALQSPASLVVGAALAALNNLIYVCTKPNTDLRGPELNPS